MAPGSRDPPPEYSLYALIVHEGSTQQLGHYYACAKVSRYWYCFNDSSVRPVHWADVSRQGAYILFYLRTRPPGSVFFYPPKSQGSGKESAGGAARVYGPQPPAGPVKSAASVDTVRMEAGSASTGPLIGRQLPPGHRGPVEASGSAKSVRSEAGNGPAVEPTGPLYGPQLPPGYRGSVEAPVSSEPTGGELGNGAEPAGPLYGPQLPLGYWGPVNAQASAEAGRLEAGNGAAAPPAGPLYGPQLPPSYSGPVGSGKGAGMVQTEVGSSTAMPPAGPPNGPRLPSVSVGPVEAISAPGIAGSESREEKCALPARPLGGIPLSLGPVSAVGGSSQSNFESSGQMKGLPARPVPQLPTPPETPPLPQGLVSQAVTAEGNPSGRCERGRIGPELSPGGAVRGPERETLVSSLDGEPLIDPRVSQEGADCPMGVTANGRTGPASGGEPNRGDVSIAVEDNVSMSRGETVAAGARERHDLKRRLSGADAPVALEPERKLSKSEGTLDFEVDGKQKTGVTNGGGSRREAAGGGNTRDAARRGGPVANAWHGASTAELVMPGVADVGNKKGQDGLHPRPDGVYRDSQIGNALGQNGKADRTGVKTTDGNEGVGRAAATASGPQHEELLDGRGGTSTRPQAAVVEARGPAACQLDAGGKVEIIDASAWSLAFSYGSDDDEECEEALKPDAIISPSASACPVEGNLFDQGSNTMQKPLPGLVEAETLLQGGAGMGIFGWSKS